MRFCFKDVKGAFLCAVPFIAAVTLLFVATGRTSGVEGKGSWRRHERQAPSETVISLHALSDGRIVAGTTESLHTFDGVRWKKKAYGSASLASHAAFFIDHTGKSYFNHNNRLAVMENENVVHFNSIELYEPLSAAEAEDGTVYIGSYFRGLIMFDGTEASTIHDGRFRSLTVDSGGNLWATALLPGNSSMKLIMWDGNEWTDRTPEIEAILPVTSNNLMARSAPDGAVWVMNTGSYGIFHEGSWIFRRNPGGGSPVAIEFDRAGGTWGYSSRTLYRLDETGKWTVARTYQSNLPNYPGFIAAAPDSSVFTFDEGAVYRLMGASWEAVDSPHDLGADLVTSVVYLDDGRLLCGHGVRGLDYYSQNHRGLSVYDGVSWTNFTEDEANNKFLNVYIMKKSPHGEVFIYSDSGYYFFDGVSFNPVDSLRVFDTTDVKWDDSDVMWLTTGKGLVQYRDPIFILHEPPSLLNPWAGVFSLAIDGDGNLYMLSVSHTGPGAVLYTDRVKWESMIQNPGGALLDIDVEEDGTLWGARITDLSRWDRIDKVWKPAVDFPDSNRFVQIDHEGRIWSSSFGKTGYLEDGVFHTIPELSGIAANTVAFAKNGRIALNAFNQVRSKYYGVYEYDPSPVSVKEPERPTPYLIATSYPNPFNPSVTIQFELPSSVPVKVEIFNIAGQRVKLLENRSFPAGVNRIMWDSITENGIRASSGVYFYRIEAGVHTKTGKMLLMR